MKRTGIAALVAGAAAALSVGAQMIHPAQSPDGRVVELGTSLIFVTVFGIAMVALAYMFYGIRALHQAAEASLPRRGRIGGWLSFSGASGLAIFSVQTAATQISVGRSPEAFWLFFFGFLSLIVGTGLLASGMRKAIVMKQYAPWVAVASIGAFVATFIAVDPFHDIGLFVFDGAWIALGTKLLTHGRQPATTRKSLIVRIGSGLLVSALVATAASCGGAEEIRERGARDLEAPRQVSLIASDSSLRFPKALESEPVSITLENRGEKAHTAFIARLNEGITMKDLRGIKSDEAFTKALTLSARMPDAKPGDSTALTADFAPGRYIIAREEDQAIARFDVSVSSGPQVARPETDIEVTVGEFYYEMPDEWPVGDITIGLTNEGEQGHNLIITDEAKEKYFGLYYAPAAGGKVWYHVSLEPGTYIAACGVLDLESGKEHHHLGMLTKFTVK
ncbi:MAG: hypothetical protein ACRDI3_03170 [Actinomycetota bacterium]